MQELKNLIEKRQYEDAWRRLHTLIPQTDSYADIVALCRARKRLAAFQPLTNSRRTLRVALLGHATIDLFDEPLALELEARGFQCELYRSNYNAATREMLDRNSPVGSFGPDVAVVVNTPANALSWPRTGESLERARHMADEVSALWLEQCACLHDRTGCEIVFDNLHMLPTRPLGNLGAKLPWDPNNFLRRINLTFAERAPAYVHIADVETLASQYGVRQWFDPRYWYHAKQPVSFDCFVPYVRNLARIIAAVFGRTAKCLVLDLDNTLWGGIVGDDGVDGIRIGPGSAVGEAHTAFQRYVLALKERGVLLAVCSKNDEDAAVRPFRERSEMLLKREDFVAFKANWKPKSENLQDIADELNIGLDALVFVDDNPVEREHVRRCLPDVGVVDLTDDPAEYPWLLEKAGFFEVTALSSEDHQRTAHYRSNVQREQFRQSIGDYGAYLADLEQKAVIRPFDERSLDRITQLINKTNQFNLTTQRMTRSEVECATRQTDCLTAHVRMADRFGDNGLISVLIVRLCAPHAAIEQWLMSCRVLNRGIEALLLNYIVQRVRELGVRTVEGVYKPTPRNGLVRDHYRSLGFTLVEEEPGGTSRWSLDVTDYQPATVNIEVLDNY